MGSSDSGASASGFLDDGRFDHASGLQSIADRHGVSLDAVRHLVQALERGHGTMAQFDHPDLGGMGQWFSGGMVMVGRMFDDGLKARVGALCTELAASLPAGGFSEAAPAARRSGGEWWPADLGSPASTGSQNGMRYAYFPESRRLAVEAGSGVVVYDTGEHHITGVSQANGSLGFTGPAGAVDLARLRRIEAEAAAPRQVDPAQAPPPERAPPGDVLATIERLAALHARGVLTDREFSDKKAELLARL
ncbi:Short C-terminal domain-containing protein [Methylobacterium phyllostachyos]|uniref:Short C-terminal domain-containing protein n=1 Tax=Methylobacterium phyllostachyos TaxID=582672 RepID=A0A1H0AG23_9HYPH|nr:SHOCT domain-containing protein [Methylobacterium phyllostachyos]SDN31736.1 Short C-terminal domain-containing protein [Methylobacterium phyllostachyos]